MDADTKEDYEILSQKYQKLSIPDKTECYSIIQRFLPGETDIQSHLECVAETAMKLGAAVKKTQMDLDLIQAASLLHDIKRREKHHARAGSVLVESLGFPEVADIIAEHMTIQFKNEITEKEIVYLADKLCNCNRVELDYTKRFQKKN